MLQAINLMRSVLENPEPLKNLASLIKAQQAFFAQAAESLASIQGEQTFLILNWAGADRTVG